MDDTAARISAWEKAGLIDAETAERLLGTLPPDDPASAPSTIGATVHGGTSLGTVFGPGVHIAEAFTYLGIGFLASAWTAFLGSLAVGGDGGQITWILGSGASALVFTGLVWFLRRGDDRWRRGAGVASLVATSFAASAVWFAADVLIQDADAAVYVLAALGSTVVAVAFRTVLPALLTQVGVLVSATTLAGAVLSFARISIFGEPSFDTPAAANDGIVLLVLQAAWWIAIGIGFGVMGLREADDQNDGPGMRRAALTRMWAALTVVIGVAVAVTSSGPLPGGGREWGRILEPWTADLALGIVAAILIERAFRRGSAAYLAGGGLALIIALSDFNASYLTDSVQTGLLVEGVILLAIGFGANRLRSRLVRPRRAPVLDAAA